MKRAKISISSSSSFTLLRSGEDSFSFSRKADQISEEAALDGIYVVRASAAHTEGLSPAELVKDYKDLKVNEAGFA